MDYHEAGRKLRNHFVNSTAINAAVTPGYALLEKWAGMSNQVSGTSRFWAAVNTYLGLGYVWEYGRDKWRERFGITERSHKGLQLLHDGLYSAAFNMVCAPSLYVVSGARDAGEIATGTLYCMLAGLPLGMLAGYTMDAFGELLDTEPSERVPDIVRRQGKFAKRAIAAGIIATSLMAMTAVYKFTPEKRPAASANLYKATSSP